jgi:hypothetical protein
MMYPVSLLFALFFVRINATYHPHLIFKKYIIVRNQKLARALIGQSDPVTPKTKNAKANRNKLSYAGIVFYGLFAVLLLMCVVFALLPDIPASNHPFAEKSFFVSGSTLNVILPGILTWVLLFAEFSFHVLNTSKYAVEKTRAKKFLCGLYVVIFALGVVMTVLCLYLAAYAIMHPM